MRKPLPKSIRFAVLERDGFACRYCGAHAPDVALHVDHITPVLSGGSDDMDNLVAACADCNSGKRANEMGLLIVNQRAHAVASKAIYASVDLFADQMEPADYAFIINFCVSEPDPDPVPALIRNSPSWEIARGRLCRYGGYPEEWWDK